VVFRVPATPALALDPEEAAPVPVIWCTIWVGSEPASDRVPPCDEPPEGAPEPPEACPPDEVGIDSQYWFKALYEGPPKQDVAEALAVEIPNASTSDRSARAAVWGLTEIFVIDRNGSELSADGHAPG
jgi:hypothetical protein